MYFNTKSIDNSDIAQLMLGGISPRPIAWVSSQDKNGVLNLAPFSFFIAVSFNPPIIAFSQIIPRNKPMKDTIKNLQEHPECVVNVVSQDLMEKANLTGGEYPSEVNEFEVANLETIDSQAIQTPGVRKAKVRYECKVREIIRFKDEAGSGIMPLLDIASIYVSDELYKAEKIDWDELNTVGRMHGDFYSTSCHKINLPKNQSNQSKSDK